MKQTKKVQLERAMTWAGTDYAPGINEMPQDAANSAVARKFGSFVESESDDETAPESAEEFAPYSIEETLDRFFKRYDWSDAVFDSLRAHKDELMKRFASSPQPEPEPEAEAQAQTPDGSLHAETKNDQAKTPDNSNQVDPNKTDSNKTESLPDDFPQRHVFEKLGLNSVQSIQAMKPEELIAIDGIAEKSAAAVLAYGK